MGRERTPPSFKPPGPGTLNRELVDISSFQLENSGFQSFMLFSQNLRDTELRQALRNPYVLITHDAL